MSSTLLYSMELRKALVLLSSLKYDRDSLITQPQQLQTQNPDYYNNTWLPTNGPILNSILERIAIVYRYLLFQFPIISGIHAAALTGDFTFLEPVDPVLNYVIPVGEVMKYMMQLPKDQFDRIITNNSLSLQLVMSTDILAAMYGDQYQSILTNASMQTHVNFAANVVKIS